MLKCVCPCRSLSPFLSLILRISHSLNAPFTSKNNHICKCQQNYTAILLLFLLTTFSFFLLLSVHYFKLVKCQCVVLKQIAVPSSEVLTFISWNRTGISTLGSEQHASASRHWCTQLQHARHCIWCTDSLVVCLSVC